MLSRFAGFVLLLGLMVLAGMVVEAAGAQKEVPKEMRSRLFKQVLADYSDIRECVTQEEGGARTAEENMSVEEVDLNRDGVSEYEVQLSGPCACGMVNCSLYIYRQNARGFESILEDAAGLGIEHLKTLSNGYVDLQVDARDTAATQAQTIYKYDGKQYREARTMIVNLETGESKPAHRRVQFKRGASSATLQGKVSIAMPDTFLVGARAGQVMTVQLTAPRQAVRFMVMNSKTSALLADNTRSWSGALPETGDYHIIVDADDKGGTYSITISIK